MTDNNPFDASEIDAPEAQEALADFMKKVDEMLELLAKLQDVSYDRLTPELWNELRDSVHFFDLLARMTKGSLMIGAQMIENPDGQAAIMAVTKTIVVPDPEALGIKVSEAGTDER